jgi:hypothetical protein
MTAREIAASSTRSSSRLPKMTWIVSTASSLLFAPGAWSKVGRGVAGRRYLKPVVLSNHPLTEASLQVPIWMPPS